jgi:flagellar M-ring protein FliF
MKQLTRIWNSLSIAQRTSLIVVPLVVCAMAFGLVRWMHENDFRTLYTALAPEDASAVTQKIREAGIEYRLDETGSTITVPSARLAEARLALAGAGLPRTGRIGFELFDKANLGASDFTEQVNYRRALEGELERTVATLTEVDQARIHLTFAKESVFLDARQPANPPALLFASQPPPPRPHRGAPRHRHSRHRRPAPPAAKASASASSAAAASAKAPCSAPWRAPVPPASMSSPSSANATAKSANSSSTI